MTPIAKSLIASEEFKRVVGGNQEPAEIKLDGYSLFVRSSDRDIGSAIAKGVSYEPHVSALLRRELARGDTFLDVGANIGYFTMMAANLVGPSGKVVAVEPMDKNLQLLYLGIEKNGFSAGRGVSVRCVRSVLSGAYHHRSKHVECARPKHSIATAAINVCADADAELDVRWAGSSRFRQDGYRRPRNLRLEGAKDILADSAQNRDGVFHHLAMRENAGVDSP